jgi:hypothetical protein
VKNHILKRFSETVSVPIQRPSYAEREGAC